jgi:hypothetical protein
VMEDRGDARTYLVFGDIDGKLGVNPGTVQRISRPFGGASVAVA